MMQHQKRIFKKPILKKFAIPLAVPTLLLGGITYMQTANAVSTEAELNAALVAANPGDTIQLTADFPLSANISTTTVSGLILNGNNHIITGNDKKGFVFNSDLDGIQNITMTGMKSNVHGGAVFVNNNLSGTITGSTFTENTSDYEGGAISVMGVMSGTITENTFINNLTEEGGGALFVGGELTGVITGSTFTGNTSNYKGGAIAVAGVMSGTITESTFTSNTASRDGGAILVRSDFSGTISNNTFIGNTASAANSYGGAIYLEYGFTGGTLSNNIFMNNAVKRNGGAVWVGWPWHFDPVTGNITGNTFTGNTAEQKGGAIYFWDEVTVNIEGNTFTGNTAGIDGGAIYAYNTIQANIANSTFTDNTAGNKGGAIYFETDATITVPVGTTSVFYNNRDSFGPNSLYFNNFPSNQQIQLNVEGELLLHDPIAGENNNLSFVKAGSGHLLLGGNNNLSLNGGTGSTWHIQAGRLTLTQDSAGNTAAINGTESFNLAAGAELYIVPDLASGNAAQINTTGGAGSIVLDGTVGVSIADDFGYHPQNAMLDNFIVLSLNEDYTGSGVVSQASGAYSLGQYDYEYNLHWRDTKTLMFNVNKRINIERSGGYAASASYRTRIDNKTSSMIFERMNTPFADLKGESVSTQSIVDAQTVPLKNNVWGTVFYNYTRYDSDGVYHNAKSKVPGLMLGIDKKMSQSSFVGGVVSISVPSYDQGTLLSEGKDYRLNVYGGTLLGKKWELGYQGFAGTGDMKHNRTAGTDRLHAKYDVNTWGAGVNFARSFNILSNLALRPFSSYEFMRISTDGYTEKGGTSSITVRKHSEDVSRVKVGMDAVKHIQSGMYVAGGLYYQTMLGDRNPIVNSYMTNTPSSNAQVLGSGVDKNAAGVNLSWGIKFSERRSFDVDYQGLFGSKSKNNNIRATLSYKF